MSSSYWNLLNCMRNCIPFINWYSMRNPITTVYDSSSSFTRSIKRQNSLNAKVQFLNFKFFKENFYKFFPIVFRIFRRFCDQKLVNVWRNFKFLAHQVVPNLFHIHKINNHSFLHWIMDFQLAFKSFFSDIRVFLIHSY